MIAIYLRVSFDLIVDSFNNNNTVDYFNTTYTLLKFWSRKKAFNDIETLAKDLGIALNNMGKKRLKQLMDKKVVQLCNIFKLFKTLFAKSK